MAIFVATPAIAQQGGVAQPSPLLPGETLLQVVAQGTIEAVPDRATLSAGVTSDGASAEAARLKNAELTDRMITAARAAGVSDDAMRTEALRVGPRFKPDHDGDDTDVVIGYRAVARLKIRLRNVTLLSKVFDALSAAGATEIDGPAFDFADDTPTKTRARAAAIVQAQAQAVDYARAYGLRVTRIIRISERAVSSDGAQDIVVTARRKANATPPLLPGAQEVTAVVWIDYALAR